MTWSPTLSTTTRHLKKKKKIHYTATATDHLHAEDVLVVERLHPLVGDVNAQLFVRVYAEILETENVENSDRATFSSEKRATS